MAAGAWADAALERELARRPLPPLDRALATELAYGAIRQRQLLDAWIDAHGRLPALRQPPRFRWLLHLGLYQLLFSQRVPAAAAVSTTVELAKGAGLGRLAPVANGLLRAVLRSRAHLAAGGPGAPPPEPWQGLPLPADPGAAFALRHSLPGWLAAALPTWLPPGDTDRAAEAFARSANTTPPLDLRVNPLRADREGVRAALEAAGHPALPLAHAPGGLTLRERPGDPRHLPGYAEGHWCVQDRSAQRVAPLLAPSPGSRLLDACAAPGGKATHLAELLGDRGEVWAVDRSAARLQRVEANARRLGLTAVRTLAADAGDLAHLRPEWAGGFAGILVDAPCSGLGTLARHADARWRIDPATIDALAERQSVLLDGLAPLLAPGGRMVYATCTVHPRENGAVVEAFLAAHPGWRCSFRHQWWPGEPDNLTADGGREADGDGGLEGGVVGGGDGFFAAVLEASA